MRAQRGTPRKATADLSPGRQLVRNIEQAIFTKYLAEQGGWAVLREVSIDDLAPLAGKAPTRRNRRQAPEPTVRRIDFLLMRTGRRSTPLHERIALEVKISRADFRRDTDEKRAAWFTVADRFAYVAPMGMIQPSELPPGCGLLEYDAEALFGNNRLKWKVVAPRKQEPPLPFDNHFFAYLMGRASRAEYALRYP